MRKNVECASCGVTPADLPYEALGLTLEDATVMFIEYDDGILYCQGCWVCAQ